MDPALAVYREFAPCAALQPYIRAILSFTPGVDDRSSSRRASEYLLFTGDAICPPFLADGHACLSFTLGAVCHADGRWRAAPDRCSGHVIGAVTHADSSSVERPSMIGAHFRAGGLAAFTNIPAHEFTNRDVAVEDVWGAAAEGMAVRLAEANEAARIDALESLLIGRLPAAHRTRASGDVARLAASIEQRAGRVTVEQAADAAGISRQHLTRLFREHVGVTPKLYARLARFQSGFAHTGGGEPNGGACAALALGYADQSHWIAEFKEFSGLTPGSFAARRWFHPFVERVRRERQTFDLPSVVGGSLNQWRHHAARDVSLQNATSFVSPGRTAARVATGDAHQRLGATVRPADASRTRLADRRELSRRRERSGRRSD